MLAGVPSRLDMYRRKLAWGVAAADIAVVFIIIIMLPNQAIASTPSQLF
jgi:hypothetical protein